MHTGLEFAAGFADPVLGAQASFRRLLEAMAHPGRIVALEPPPAVAPLDPATVAVALTLLDYDTPVWLDGAASTAQVRAHLGLHCGCPLVAEMDRAAFGIVADPGRTPALQCFHAGSDEAPQQGATVVVQVRGLRAGTGVCLRGPGIDGVAHLGVEGVTEDFWASLRAQAPDFPRGVDLVLTCGTRLACLPRSVRVDG